MPLNKRNAASDRNSLNLRILRTVMYELIYEKPLFDLNIFMSARHGLRSSNESSDGTQEIPIINVTNQ